MPSITRDQLAAATFSHPTSDIRVFETHLSFVVLTGELAYKIKKAVSLDFIDTTALERRRQLCEDELRLNRRYAPELYLRVVAITIDAGVLQFDATGEAIEYAVQMRQFDPRHELQTLLKNRAVSESELSALADGIAEFHKRAAILDTIDQPGTRAFLDKAHENVASISARIGAIQRDAEMSRLRDWTQNRLMEDLPRLERRERTGHIRECHGDLHSGNVVRWKGALLPFDCIEFDSALRFIDVMNDIAFLAMDLLAQDRRDLAFTLLNRYLERVGDYAGVALLPCYIVYRALVRTKVELIALEQRSARSDASERAQAYLDTALYVAYPLQKPLLIIMHGASGSGKSWLSAQLVPKIAALRIRSDLERKRLAGLDPFDSFAEPDPSIYTLEFNDRTYTHLLNCARECLQGGVNVIVDAAFLKVRERREFAALAQASDVPFLLIACSADPATLAARIASRRKAGNDPSDADERIMRRQLDTMEALANDERTHSIDIDTRAADAVARVLAQVRHLQAR